MAQGFPRFCPRCGATTIPNQRLCVRCGLDLAPWLPQQRSQPSSQPGYQPADFQPPASSAAEPGMPTQPGPGPGQPVQAYNRPVSQPGFQPVGLPEFQAAQSAWNRAPQQQFPQYSPVGYGGATPPSAPVQAHRRRGIGKLGLAIIVLLVLAALGGAGYIGLRYQGNRTQTAITTTSINSTVTYAGVTITVLKVEQSQRFIDDPSTADDGMLRMHLQAQNKTAVPVNLLYNTIATLVMPGGKTLTPTYVKANVGVAPGRTQTGIVDFAVPTDAKVNQLRLRLGAPDEAQVDIPLMQGANPAQYAPKTTNLNGTFQYLGLNWSLMSATTQLSIAGKQASKGMYYVTVALKVDNTLSQTAIPGSPYDYMRLKAGNTTATPVNTSLPVSFVAGENGKTGTVMFLVPQNTVTLTLILLAQPQSGFDQVTKAFQLS